MKPRRLLVAVCIVGAAIGCSLNPQPLPPDTTDAAMSLEAGNGPDDATTTFGDSAPPPEESGVGDAEPGAGDASDASDASDAADANVSDATLDALDD